MVKLKKEVFFNKELGPHGFEDSYSLEGKYIKFKKYLLSKNKFIFSGKYSVKQVLAKYTHG